MTSRTKLTAAAAAALVALAIGGAAFVQASGDDDDDKPATGPQADRASAAALKVTGGGTANAVERDGENGATWEVEVTKTDGSTVDVRLGERYELVVIEGDDDDGDE